MPETATQTKVRELTFAEAIREALAEEMRRDSRVCILGEDVAEAGTPFKVLSGLVEEFGKERVWIRRSPSRDSRESGVGAAMTGLRPVVDIMFGDFLTLIMDQIVNQAAKIHYMSGGTWKVPMVLRTTHGRDAAFGGAAFAIAARLVQPRSGTEGGAAVDALRRQGADENGHSRRQSGDLLRRQDDVPAEGPGAHRGVHDSASAWRTSSAWEPISPSWPPAAWCRSRWARRSCWKEIGISAEVIDPRTIWPLDEKTLIESAKKTSRVIVIDEGYDRYGVTAEIASVIAEGAFYNLDGPVKRDGGDARADSLLSSARRRDRAERAGGIRSGAGALRKILIAPVRIEKQIPRAKRRPSG